MKLKMSIKKVLSMFLIGTMMVLMVACKGNSSKESEQNISKEVPKDTEQDVSNESDDKKENVTLEFQQWWGVELPDGVLQGICDKFTEQTNIKIKLLSNPYADTKTQIAAGAAAGTMADVVGLDGSWVYDFAKQGSIANLTQLMEADGYDDSKLSDQIKVDGSTYMIPVVNFAYPMYVNKDILADAGINEIPKDWSSFMEVCENVTNKDKNIYGWAIPLSTESPSGIQNNFMSWLWASGGSMLDNGKPDLTNNSDLVKTVEFVKGMFDAGVVTPGAYAMKEADMVEEFANGRIAFMIDSLAHLTMIRNSSPDLGVDIINVPVMEGYSGTSGMDVASWGIGIAENCEYKEEAIKFVEYMMSEEVNAQLAEVANAFPGNTYSKPAYEGADELFIKAYEIFQECHAINEFTGLPTSEELMRNFDEQLQLYIDGDTSNVEDMLSATQEIWNKAFK